MNRNTWISKISAWFMVIVVMLNVSGFVYPMGSVHQKAQWAQEKVAEAKKEHRLNRLVNLYKSTIELHRKKKAGTITVRERKILKRRMARIEKGAHLLGITAVSVAAVALVGFGSKYGYKKWKESTRKNGNGVRSDKPVVVPVAMSLPDKEIKRGIIINAQNYKDVLNNIKNNIVRFERENNCKILGKLDTRPHMTLLFITKLQSSEVSELNKVVKEFLRDRKITLKPFELRILGPKLVVQFKDDSLTMQNMHNDLKRKLKARFANIAFDERGIIPHISLGSPGADGTSCLEQFNAKHPVDTYDTFTVPNLEDDFAGVKA